MNKLFLMFSCVIASSFLCASEQSQSSPRKLTISALPRKLSNPSNIDKPKLPQDTKTTEPFNPLITRTKKYSLANDQFMDEENARKIFGKDSNENS